MIQQFNQRDNPMAVHNENNGNNSATGAADAAARGQANAGQGGDQNRSGRSIFGLNNRLFRPMERAATGEMVKKYVDALTKDGEASFKAAGGVNWADAFKLVVLESGQDQVALSAILVCYSQQYQGKQHTAVFTLILEGSGQSSLRTSRFVPIGGKQVEIEIVAGDTFNQTMWDRVVAKVQSVYGTSIILHNGGAATLPNELSPDDSAHIHRVLYNATAALFTILDLELNQSQDAFSVSWIDKDAQKTAALDYNPLPITDAVGLPVRTDLSISTRAAKGEQGNDLHEQSIELTRVDGFVDLIYAKPDVVQVGYGVAPTTQCYYPRYIITRVDSQVDALTPELHLLGISTSSMLWTSRSWMSAFLPRYSDSDVAELRDLGAVGYECNLTGDPQARVDRIDTRADSFTTQSLQQLIQTTIRDKLVISMDVAERGEQSWLANMYIRAANGDQDAVNAIVKAADNLTDGHFSRVFNSRPNHGILRDDQNRIHLGYWKTRKGDLRDIRDFDYLAVLNRLAAVDPQAPVDWSATFDNLEIPLEMRLEKRAHILRSLSGETFRLKGFARRVTFSADFIAALNEACFLAGLIIRPSNINVDLTGGAGRAQYDASNMAWAGGGGAGMFSYDTNPYGKGYVGVGANVFGARWQGMQR
jgi:hypothetical protein